MNYFFPHPQTSKPQPNQKVSDKFEYYQQEEKIFKSSFGQPSIQKTDIPSSRFVETGRKMLHIMVDFWLNQTKESNDQIQVKQL